MTYRSCDTDISRRVVDANQQVDIPDALQTLVWGIELRKEIVMMNVLIYIRLAAHLSCVYRQPQNIRGPENATHRISLPLSEVSRLRQSYPPPLSTSGGNRLIAWAPD
jgi:hypothetical protein